MGLINNTLVVFENVSYLYHAQYFSFVCCSFVFLDDAWTERKVSVSAALLASFSLMW